MYVGESRFKKHFSILIFWYRLIGMWPSERFCRFPYSLLTAFMVSVIVWFSVSHLAILIVLVGKDLMEAVTKTNITYEFIFCTSVKYYYNMTHLGRIKALLAKTDTGHFSPKTERQLEILNGPIDTWGKMVRTYITMTLCSNFVSWGSIVLQEKHQFILDIWVPCDIDENSCFYVALPWQLFAALVNTVVTFYTPLYTVGFLIYAGAQMDLLADKIRNVREESVEATREVFGSQMREGYEAVLEEEVRRRFGQCLEHHKAIVDFVKDLNIITREINFAVYASIIGTSCVCLLSVVISTDVLLCAFYSSAAFCFWLELGMICWFGTELIEKSIKLSDAAYESNWEDCSTAHKKHLLFFIQIAQKPLKLSAIDIIPISLDVGTKILRTSWSYFLVLQQVYGEEP